MGQSAADVARQVRDAFDTVTLGDGIGLREADGMDDYADFDRLRELRAADEKEDWSRIDSSDLDAFSAALSFFDPLGMRFHLPAYLIADLADQLTLADVVFHLCYSAQSADTRFGLLNKSQRSAVRSFLEYSLVERSRRHDGPDCDLMRQALRGAWSD